MSDYFFYDLNKKMADLANKQQLAETAQATPVKPAPNRLMEAAADYSAKKAAAGKDIGKPGKNFSKIAADAGKRYGSAEAGKRVAGAVLNKLRHTEESIDQAQLKPWKATMKEGGKPDFLDLDKDGNRKEPMKSAARGAKKDMDESALQAAFGKKKYGDQGMKALQKAGRDHASAKTMNNIRNKYDKYDESMTDEGNAFSGAVVKAKRDGIQPGERITVGGKQYELKEVDATPQHVDEPVSRPATKASAARSPVPPPKKTGQPKMYPPQAIDDPVKEAAKYRSPKYKDKLYTQEPPDYTYGPDMDDAYDNPKPDDYAGRKLKIGGGSDPLTRGFRMSADKSINTHGKRKGLPSRDQITSLKGSIKDVLGKHTEPNLPEGGVPMSPKQKKFAALAKPFDKITFADKIVGAKKEVDEMLGDVAASAMKKAVRGRNRDMEEGFMDDEPTSRRSSSGGRIDTSEPGVTRHRAVKGNYSGAGHDASADDEPSGAVGRRRVGAGQGKKIGAKINRGISKLMTKEGDMPEDMIEPEDSGEYDREGEMAKDDIKTVVRHAQALEKILGDEDNLPEWVQAKLAKIENMMTAVDDYMQNQKSGDMEMDEESTNKRDNRDERAGRKVAKDIEYDEKKKDGIHGKRRGSEDSKAERAGRKVTKDIEYDEKKKKKKEVDETTSSGSVATGGAAPKSSGSVSYGKGIYDSLNRQLENMISESMNINMSMNNDDHGGPRKSLTVTATDDDAVMLAGLLKMAGMGHGDEHIYAMTGDDSGMDALHDMDHMHGEEPCADCGQTECECDGILVTEGLFGSHFVRRGDGDAYVNKMRDIHKVLTKGGYKSAGLATHLDKPFQSAKYTHSDSTKPDVHVDRVGNQGQIHVSMQRGERADLPNKDHTEKRAHPRLMPVGGGLNTQKESIFTDIDPDEESCSACGSSPCGCDDEMMDEDRWGAEQSPKLPNDMSVTGDGGVDVNKDGSNWVYKSKEPGGRVTVTIPAKASNKMLPNTTVDETYGDTDATENKPDYPTDEEGTDDAMMYSGGLNGPKSTGQTTIPVIAGQDDRMGHELRRMMEIAGLR